MKSYVFLSLLMASFFSFSQIITNIPVRINVFGNFMDVEAYNNTNTDLNCQGWITLFNAQNSQYGQFFYNQFIWSRSSASRSYYLGPYANGNWVRVVNNTIQCW